VLTQTFGFDQWRPHVGKTGWTTGADVVAFRVADFAQAQRGCHSSIKAVRNSGPQPANAGGRCCATDVPSGSAANSIVASSSLEERADALMIVANPLVLSNMVRINILAAGAHLPTSYIASEYVQPGGLLSTSRMATLELPWPVPSHYADAGGAGEPLQV
jgi:hypothetical protein